MEEWISVYKKLPENFQSVLCYVVNTSTSGQCCTLGSCHNGTWFLQSKVGGNSFPHHYWKVTYWQPLPEPPKVGVDNG